MEPQSKKKKKKKKKEKKKTKKKKKKKKKKKMHIEIKQCCSGGILFFCIDICSNIYLNFYILQVTFLCFKFILQISNF